MNYLHIVENKPVHDRWEYELPRHGIRMNLPSKATCIGTRVTVTGSWLHRLLCYFEIRKPTHYTIDLLYCWED